MLKVELVAAGSKPGHALLNVQGWTGDAGALELSIQRNQDQYYLGDQGSWSGQPVWFGISLDAQADGPNLVAEVGPWLVDALLLEPQMVYMLYLRQNALNDKGVLRLKGNLLSSQAAGQSLHQEAHLDRTPKPAPKPEPEPLPEPLPTPAPKEEHFSAQRDEADDLADSSSLAAEPRETQPTPPPKPRSKAWLWILLGLVLAGAMGVGVWWWLQQQPAKTEPTPAPAASTEPAPASAPTVSTPTGEAACAAEALQQNSDDLAFIRGCLDSKPNAEQVLAVIERAKAAKRCNVVQRLYAFTAQSGNAAVAVAYAAEYDPKTFKAEGCIKSADKETAQYWYEQALVANPNNAQARERLEALKK